MAEYKHYAGTLIADLEIIAQSDLSGQKAKGGYIINDDVTNSFSVQMKFFPNQDYGDLIEVKAKEQLRLFDFPPFYAIKLVHTIDVNYRVLLGRFKTGVE